MWYHNKQSKIYVEELGLEPRIYACKAYVIASLTKPPNYVENICVQKMYYNPKYNEVSERITATY